MSEINRLTEEQARVWARMQSIRDAAADENRDLTAEERANWDKAEARLTEIRQDVERYERMARLEAAQAAERSAVPAQVETREEAKPVDYRDAFVNYVRRGITGLDPEQRSALEQRTVTPIATTPGSQGGFLVPVETLNKITETMKAYGGILGQANVITTSTGNPINWPSNDDTANVGGILGEGLVVPDSTMTFGQKTLGAFTYTSGLLRVNLQLLQDSLFDIEAYITRKLGERIGRAVAAHLATGSGTTMPEGLFTNATAGVIGVTGETVTVSYNNLIDLVHSVDPAYRTTAKFIMNDASMGKVRELVDTQGRPLWQPNVQAGNPDTLLGYPVVIDNNVPVMAANAKSIGFGDLNSAYVIRQVSGGHLLRLEERYADFLQVGFFAFMRLDAKPDDTAAFRVFENSAT